jgi:hypothetical protein
MKLMLSARSLIIWLFILVLVVNAIGFIGRSVEFLVGYEGTTEFVSLFHVGREGNITTWFSSILLFISSFILGVIAVVKWKLGAPFTKHWAALGVIFLYLSMDEMARIHERTIEPLRVAFQPSGFLYYAWVMVALPLVLLFALVYLRFVFNLPKTTRILFVAAGATFVFGALGLEMIGGFVVTSELGSSSTIAYGLQILEEFFENVGVAIFISALVLYMQQNQELHELTFELI